ncbi:restriction endonuclease subunit S [Vibrio coralliilyticus]|uniref:restriction endonuclease subunit S n=1 Tax=Vibrio TaxID=662 RepID=UPI00068D1EC5|nr:MULTISPECIES: restriction endonuclease subunit S [Vibrio]NOI18677.1 restriction endonuclease subunit S [Vibrio coralliilyticus]
MSNALKLGDVAVVKGGSGFPEKYQGGSHGLPFIKVSDMNLPGNQRYIWKSNNYLNTTVYNLLKPTVFPRDTVVFAKVGAAVYLNKRRILTEDTAIDNNLMGVTATAIEPLFLYYLLQSIDLAEWVQPGALPSINQTIIEALPIPITDRKQQRYICEVLNAVDNQIDATQALIDKYTAIKQGMMVDLFSRGIDPETKALRPTFEEAPELYHETSLGMLPKAWKVKTLREYTTRLEQGWSPDCESEPAFEGEWGVLKTSAVVWEGYLPGENKRLPRKLKPKDKYEVYPGDVLITRAGPGSRVGVVAFVNTTPKRLMLSDKLYRLRFDSRLDGMFASYLLSCELVQSQLNKVKTGLAESQANISQEIVMSLRIAVPNADEQKVITNKIRSAENYLNLEREHLDKLLAQKAGLMQDLLTGKVPVPA